MSRLEQAEALLRRCSGLALVVENAGSLTPELRQLARNAMDAIEAYLPGDDSAEADGLAVGDWLHVTMWGGLPCDMAGPIHKTGSTYAWIDSVNGTAPDFLSSNPDGWNIRIICDQDHIHTRIPAPLYEVGQSVVTDSNGRFIIGKRYYRSDYGWYYDCDGSKADGGTYSAWRETSLQPAPQPAPEPEPSINHLDIISTVLHMDSETPDGPHFSHTIRDLQQQLADLEQRVDSIAPQQRVQAARAKVQAALERIEQALQEAQG